MSSSICNEHSAWHVSNMMFARVLDFAREVAAEVASSDEQRVWVNDLGNRLHALGTYSPDIEVAELFSNLRQLEFWSSVLHELARRIWKGRIGDQRDQTWQTSTIWAAVDLARLFDSSASMMRFGAGRVAPPRVEFDTYEGLRDYLRRFANFGGEIPYDFNGVVHLTLALLDNLRDNAIEEDLARVRGSMSDKQAAFLLRLAKHVREGAHDG